MGVDNFDNAADRFHETTLGGKIEGVVIKNRSLPAADTGFMKAKVVSKEFQEEHQGDWKDRNPNRNDVIVGIVEEYATTARYDKAVQHLRESGKLTGERKDIGPLMKELSLDFEAECAEEIAGILYKHFRKGIMRGVCAGMPGYYKTEVLEEV